MTSVSVLCRVCPAHDEENKEINPQDRPLKIVCSKNSLSVSGAMTKTFNFDQCFSSSATNENLCAYLVPNILQSCFNGENVSVVGYGNSNSGKTHSFFGGKSEEGVTQVLLKSILSTSSRKDKVRVSVSFMDVLNEEIEDLLGNKTNKRPLRVQEDSRGTFVEGLCSVFIENLDSAMSMVRTGLARKRSRSHTIFQIDVTMVHAQVHDGVRILKSKIQLVDLASSDTIRNQDNTFQVLSSVVKSLTSNDHSGPVPYRNSVLTWLLQDTLGGNSKTYLLATILPEAHQEFTFATLIFAEKFKMIKNPVRKNEDSSSVLFRTLMREIQVLRSRLGLEEDSETSVVSSSKRKRFSTEALNTLNRATTEDKIKHYQEQVKMYKERALQAERDSKERGELLWEAFESLRKQLIQVTQQAKEEAKKQIHFKEDKSLERSREEEEQFESLIEQTAALTINVAWRKYQLRKMDKTLFSERESRREERLRLEKESKACQEENEKLKIQVIQRNQNVKDCQKEIETLKSELQIEIKNRMNLMENYRDVQNKLALEQNKNLAAFDSSSAEKRIREELKQLQMELKGAQARARGEEESAKKEVQRLAEAVAIKDQEIETVQAKRVAAEKEVSSLNQRLTQLESDLKKNQQSSQKLMEEREEKVRELQKSIDALQRKDEEAKKARDIELESLREQNQQLEANAAYDLEKLTLSLKERGDADSLRAEKEIKTLRAKLGSLEILLETNKANMEKEVEERENVIEELEKKNEDVAKREKREIERKNQEIEELQLIVRRLEKDLEETKLLSDREVNSKETKLRELERTLNDNLIAQQKSIGGSFLQYRNDHSRRLSIIPTAASTMLSTTRSHQQNQFEHEELLCVRVDVENFDEKLAAFMPCSSSVSPEDPSTRTFNVKSPMYDLKKSRWSRVRIRVLHSSIHRVDQISSICLEHHLPGQRCVMHQLKVIKTERNPHDQGVTSVSCDWDASTSATTRFVGNGENGIDPALANEPCFCFQRLEESGPMTLHATFLVNDQPVHWEYPLRFKNKPGFVEKIPGVASFLTRRTTDDVKHEYLNSSWFSFGESEAGTVRADAICDGPRVISCSGYLQKSQTHRSGKVLRWFVFAPPFLFCYHDALKAAEDFTQARALPHSARRALRITPGTRIVIENPKILGMEKIDFSVITKEKTWNLQAASRKELDVWTSTLNGWVRREKDLSFEGGFDQPTTIEEEEV